MRAWGRLLLLWTAASCATFGAATAGDPVVAPTQRLLALLEADRWQEALDLVRTSPPGDDADPSWVSAVAQAEFRAGEVERAERLLADLAGAMPEERVPPRAAMLLARLHDSRGRSDAAERWLRVALSRGADDPWVLYWASDVVKQRSEARGLLESYLEQATGGEDPDRLESAAGTIRVYRELGDRPVWVPRAAPEQLELPLRLIWDDTGRRLGYVVTALAGPKAKPLKLLLDTGSGGLFVVERVARKRGFEPLASETTFGGGGDRRQASLRGLWSEFSLGALRFEDALLSTSPTELELRGRYHGVLGVSVFAGYVATFDPKNKRLLLKREAESHPDATPYWTLSGQMLVRAEVGQGVSGLFLLDTGATSTILSRSFVEGLAGATLLDGARVRGYGGVVQGARWVRGVEVSFQGRSTGERDLGTVDLSLRNRLAGVELAGFLGLDLLEGARIVIDSGSRTVRVVGRE